MKLRDFSSDLEKRAGIGIVMQVIMVLLLVTVVAQAIALARADRTHHETLIPPSINKTFWVEDERVSPSYLEQMGLFLIQLSLNRTPINAESQIRELLKYVAPGSYVELEKSLLSEAQRQKDDKITTMFTATNVAVSENRQAVLFDGILMTWMTDKLLKQEAKKYLIIFGYAGGKVYIQSIKEVTNEKDPWGA
jgi:conjugal transfer pilus assembly protein TraE